MRMSLPKSVAWNPQEQDTRRQRVLPVGVYHASTERNGWFRQRFGSQEKLLAEFPKLTKEMKQ